MIKILLDVLDGVMDIDVPLTSAKLVDGVVFDDCD
jgi:hypothetical protein